MAKLKSSVLSLGARGSLGDSITFQSRKGDTIARTKPTPTDPKSLAQMYQRWDYEWYANKWHSLSAAEILAYRKIGSRRGITAFNAYMSDQLKTLPELEGRYRLDERSATTIIDSSSHGRDGTIFGPTPSPGRIDSGYYFDGVNDVIKLPNLWSGTVYAVCVFIYPFSPYTDGVRHRYIGTSGIPGADYFGLYKHPVNDSIFNWRCQGVSKWIAVTIPFPAKVWYCLAGQYDPITHDVTLWYNGDLVGTTPGGLDPTPELATRNWLGWNDATTLWGSMDEALYFNRILTPIEHKMLAERRYPL